MISEDDHTWISKPQAHSSLVTCRSSLFTRHLSLVTRHLSLVTCHSSLVTIKKTGQADHIAPLQPPTLASFRTWGDSAGADRMRLTRRCKTMNFYYIYKR